MEPIAGQWSKLTRRQALRGAAGGAVGLSAFGLAGCLGDSEEGGGARSGPPRRGGRIQIAFTDASDTDTLDPAFTVTDFEKIVHGLLFNPLVLSDQQHKIKPALAERWETSDDFKVWTFHLRRGVEWHDGTPLRAKDVAFTIGRVLNKEFGAETYTRLAPSLDPDGIRVLDDHTIRLELKRPDSLLLFPLSERWMSVVQDGAKDFSKAVGTGPFRLKSFKPGQAFEVERNPAYWDGNKPYLDVVRGVVIAEGSTKVQSVVSGESDLCDSIETASIQTVDGSSSARTVRAKDAFYTNMAVDQTVPPFDDNRVRMALKLAMDRKRILEVAYGGLGTATSDVPVRASDPYYPESLGIRGQDVDEARRLLREAGHDTLRFTLQTSAANAGMVDFAIAYADSVKDAGIEVEIDQRPPVNYWDRVWLKQPAYVSYWNWRHPNEMLSVAFASESPSNEPKFRNGRFDELVINQRATQDEAELKRLYSDALLMLADSSGFICPAFQDRVWAAKNHVQGLDLDLVRHDLANLGGVSLA